MPEFYIDPETGQVIELDLPPLDYAPERFHDTPPLRQDEYLNMVWNELPENLEAD